MYWLQHAVARCQLYPEGSALGSSEHPQSPLLNMLQGMYRGCWSIFPSWRPSVVMSVLSIQKQSCTKNACVLCALPFARLLFDLGPDSEVVAGMLHGKSHMKGWY